MFLAGFPDLLCVLYVSAVNKPPDRIPGYACVSVGVSTHTTISRWLALLR